MNYFQYYSSPAVQAHLLPYQQHAATAARSLHQEVLVKRQAAIAKMTVLLFGTLCLCLTLFGGQADAAVNIGVNVGLPPLFRLTAPPPVVVIPGTYVYVVPDIAVDIFFFRGAWYRPHEGHWFRSTSYNGPWRFVAPNRMPQEIVGLPHHDYRNIPPGHRRIPYGQMKKGWRGWERHRYWDRDVVWREGWQRHDDRDMGGIGDGPGRPDGRGQGPRGHDMRNGGPKGFQPTAAAGPGRGHNGRDWPHER